MEIKSAHPRKLAGVLFCQISLKYFFKNWVNLFVLFMGFYAIFEGIIWLMRSFYIDEMVARGIIFFPESVVSFLLFIFCTPFVANGESIPSLGNLSDQSGTFRKNASRAFWWSVLITIIYGVSLGLGVGGVAILAQSALSPLLLLPIGVVGAVFVIWIGMRVSLYGVALACGDTQDGWQAVGASWKTLKGLAWRAFLGYIWFYLVLILGLAIITTGFALISSMVFGGQVKEFIFGGEINMFSYCILVIRGGLLGMGGTIYLGCLYRIRRDDMKAYLRKRASRGGINPGCP